jgi:hypothetical protein
MDYQVMFNLLYGAFAFLCGFLLNNLWKEIKSGQKTDKEIIDRVSAIEVLVAGDYTTRQEFNHTMDKVFSKLDQIAAALNTKADR